MHCSVTICCERMPVEVTANAVLDLAAARVPSEDGIVVDIEDGLFQRVWDNDLRIGVNGANQQAVVIVFQ